MYLLGKRFLLHYTRSPINIGKRGVQSADGDFNPKESTARQHLLLCVAWVSGSLRFRHHLGGSRI